MRQSFLKRTVMTPNCHAKMAVKVRHVNPTLERYSKQSLKGRSGYFRTAGYTKESTKIYRRKSCRTIPRTPNSPIRAKLQVIWPFLRRLAVLGGRKSSRRQSDPNLEESHTETKREFQGLEGDDSSGESEYFRKRKNDYDGEEHGGNFQKIKKPATPNLSHIQRSNFRIRLYYQLNVVKRVKEKPSYLHSLPCERSNLKRYRPVTRLSNFVVERSKPIAIHARRISHVDFEDSKTMLRDDKTSQSDSWPDNEDVFALDIEPISMC